MRLVPFDELGTAELDAWHTLRAKNPQLDSPYFHPSFAEAVHACGTPVTVAVGDGLDVLLPCHRDGGLLRPAGWPGADFQAPILAPGTAFDPLALLTAGVRAFEFDHLLESCPGFGPWVVTRRPSPYLDTSGGLSGYLSRASRSGKENMGQARRRAARAEREEGPVTFVADSADQADLEQLIALKRAQYAATGARDYFASPGRRLLVQRLLRTREPDFGGLLSTLRVGSRLVAAHFGLRSGGVLHWWFPVYDPAYARLAPGWILLRELVAASPQLGVTRIDLGRGEDEYKRRARTGEVEVCQGLVTRNPLRLGARAARESLRRNPWLRRTLGKRP
ncbi:GNAT family N-acetyltransferase [Nonomuraea sp. NPDC000554]|uniref:GNAT family N-acetyltransferase n=1 Tax=Nonomuraea sp. NPDC000554 TaxID=3154259 RepID=UPI00332CC76D